jgi:predicted transcriptional regulator
MEAGVMEDKIISLTAQIVSAHIAGNDVATDQLPRLIRDVHKALATVGQAPIGPAESEPAVAAKKSIFADHILCLDCGGSFKMLKRHIQSDHKMTPDEYRAKWGLPIRIRWSPPNMQPRVHNSPRTADWGARLTCLRQRRLQSAVVRRRAKAAFGAIWIRILRG